MLWSARSVTNLSLLIISKSKESISMLSISNASSAGLTALLATSTSLKVMGKF
mgnify:CR=1 FL=1